jgi:hypothetical protein
MPRFSASLSMIAGLLLITGAPALTTGRATPQSLTGGQNEFITSPDASAPPGVPTREVVRLRVADGYFVFVQMLSGEVGIVAQGQSAVQILRAITATYPTTPLDIFERAGGDRLKAPAALLSDYQQRQITGGPTAPLPPFSSIQATSASVQGVSDLGVIGGAACVQGSQETFDYFSSWWGGLFWIPGVGALADIGAQGQEGIGIWDQGPANLTLGSTSAGAALVCFPEGESSTSGARVTVQEYWGNGLWLDLWSTPSVFSGAAYGYWFKGYLVHKVRVLIRDSRPLNQQNPPIGPFYWAGAY